MSRWSAVDLAEMAAGAVVDTGAGGRGGNGATSAGSTWAEAARSIGPVCWAWEGWIAMGFLTLVVAAAGQGKSQLLLRLAGSFLSGLPWPDGTPFHGEPGSAVWCEGEAGQALNVARARSWGLPLERIVSPLPDVFADLDLTCPGHFDALAAAAHRPEVRIVLVDSLSGCTGGRTRPEDLLPVVVGLAALARDLGKPILLSHHLRKRSLLDSGDGVALDRVRDSSTIVQPARVVLAIDAPDAATPSRRRMSLLKSNLAGFPSPIGFEILESGPVFGAAPTAPRVESQSDRAADLLRALLAHGPRRANELEAEGLGAGISWRTMIRAKDMLNVVSRRDGGSWKWGLPTAQRSFDE